MTTRLELQNYLQEKKVEEILSEVVQEVLRERPSDVIPFMMSTLEGFKVRYGSGAAPAAGAAAPAPAASPAAAAAPASDAPAKPRATFAAAPPSVAPAQPVFLPESPLDTESDVENRLALMGRRYSQARSRRTAVSSGHEEDNFDDFEPKVVPKPPEAEERIARAVANNFLFKNLDDKQRRIIFDALFESHAVPGEAIITEGEEGDNFYILDSGEVEIFKNIEGKETKVLQLGPGGAFGELALMYNTPRQATVKALGMVRMWALDRRTYRYILLDTTMKKRKLYETFLQSVPLLEALSNYERAIVADSLNEIRFDDGQVIIREGEPGDNFYIIEEGTVTCTKNVDGKQVGVADLHASEYFGELALLNNAPRAATVTAVGPVKCVWLDRSSFVRLLGPCEEIMKRKDYTTPTGSH